MGNTPFVGHSPAAGVPDGAGRGVKLAAGAGDVTVGVTVGLIVGVPAGVGVGTQAANRNKVTIQYRFASRIGYIMPP